MSLRFSFWSRIGLALLLAAAGDLFLFGPFSGLASALFGFCLIVALLAARPEVLRHRPALGVLALALLLLAALVERPGALAAVLFVPAVGAAALLPRAPARLDAWRGLRAVVWRGALTPVSLGIALAQIRGRLGPGPGFGQVLGLLALPLGGGLLFLLLFSSANPLVEQALSALTPWSLLGGVTPGRLLFWGVCFLFAYGLLRPARLRWRVRQSRRPVEWPGVSTASVRLSLLLFNLLFAIENTLDLAFLWSGAALPEGVTLAAYAHRGAYPLIFTALLAGLFVLAALRPGTRTAADPLLRRLVVLWIGQNILLVASSLRRTLAYIDAYSLTELRLLALVWMALVALGLGLICFRLLAGRSGAWLINANAAAAGATVLLFLLAIDPAAVVAGWNTRHNLERTGQGVALDWDYLDQLGDAALLPLLALERSDAPDDMRRRAAALRQRLLACLERRQARPAEWSFLGARRLAEAKRLIDREGRE
ncbi:DUF4173 domain-containing protein [Zavarzinia compransoris]|nr:DUF4173 domain-containing protein [Zavarzinia compransoris]TDP48962.1 uncharacterized protein DUF4173 [Zavarzinia compransoris]